MCWLADHDRSSLVPETSRYTLEELHAVFSQDTRKIIRTGWAQLKWLITGVGDNTRHSGRWVREEYPRLVPPRAFRDDQELEDVGGLASGSEVTNGAIAHRGTGTESRHFANTRDLEV